MAIKKKIRRQVGNFKEGFRSKKKPKSYKLGRAVNIGMGIGEVAGGGFIGTPLGIATIGSELGKGKQRNSRAGRLGAKVGSAAFKMTAARKKALKLAQQASAKARRKR